MQFRPGRGPTLLTLFAVALLCSLGIWQVHRLHWRRSWLAARNARIDLPPVPIAEVLAHPRDFADRRATARGRFDPTQTLLVARASRGEELGDRVLTPLRLAGAGDAGPALLVDRGWIPAAEGERFLREPEPSADVEVTGLVLPLELGDAPPGSAPQRRSVWLRFDPERSGPAVQAQIPYPLAPVMLQRQEDGSGGWPAGGFLRPTSPVDHRAYAITWFSLAALAVAAWLEHGISQGRTPGPPADRALH
jgi:surfeit locus 1 family protein